MRGTLPNDLTKRLALYFVVSSWPIALSSSVLALVAPREDYVVTLRKCEEAATWLTGSTLPVLALGPIGLALPVQRAPYWGAGEALLWVVVCVLLINAPAIVPGAKGWVLAWVGAAIWLALGF